jgi:hypothetical protein
MLAPKLSISVVGKPSPFPMNGEAPVNGGAPIDGGAERDRTDDLLLAKQALSHLSYSPEYQNLSGVAPGSRRVAKAAV